MEYDQAFLDYIDFESEKSLILEKLQQIESWLNRNKQYSQILGVIQNDSLALRNKLIGAQLDLDQ